MKSEDIARYLQDHPEFFEQYADLLSLVTLPDPHNGRAISITEKQLVTLRDKVRALEAKLGELIGFGEENDAISAKVHGLAVALIAAGDQAGVMRTLYSHLGGAFAVPHVTLRLWSERPGDGHEFEPVADALKAFASSLQPYCGPVTGQESLNWFGESATHLRSMTQIALRESGGTCFGLLVMASEEPHRFYPELGTLYLERIGEMATAALRRVVLTVVYPHVRKTGELPPEEADISLETVLREMADGSVGHFLTELTIQRGASPHTLDAYRRDLARLAELAAGADLKTLKPPQLRRGLMALHARSLAPRSIARTLSAWRSHYAWLARRGAIALNPADGLRAPKRPHALPKALGIDQTAALLDRPAAAAAAQENGPLQIRDAAMFELLYSSGLRLAELVSLDWPGGLDLAAGEVTVTGKRRKTRTVPVGDKARAALEAWLTVRPQLLRGEEAALFLGRNGTRLTPRQVESRLAQWAQRQGVGVHVHPHMLRHSFASHVLQSSGDLRAVQEMLGHASIAATQIYTHLDFQHLAKVYDSAHPRAKSK